MTPEKILSSKVRLAALTWLRAVQADGEDAEEAEEQDAADWRDAMLEAAEELDHDDINEAIGYLQKAVTLEEVGDSRMSAAAPYLRKARELLVASECKARLYLAEIRIDKPLTTE